MDEPPGSGGAAIGRDFDGFVVGRIDRNGPAETGADAPRDASDGYAGLDDYVGSNEYVVPAAYVVPDAYAAPAAYAAPDGYGDDAPTERVPNDYAAPRSAAAPDGYGDDAPTERDLSEEETYFPGRSQPPRPGRDGDGGEPR